MSLIRKYIPYVLAATLFIQGLYFTHHILIALIGLIIVFGIIVIKNQHTKIPQDKVFYFFVLFFCLSSNRLCDFSGKRYVSL